MKLPKTPAASFFTQNQAKPTVNYVNFKRNYVRL
jgi:hypothetical protein